MLKTARRNSFFAQSHFFRPISSNNPHLCSFSHMAPTCAGPPPPPPPPPLEAYAYALWIVAGAALLLVACLLLWLLVLRRRLHGKILEPRESPAPLASLSAAALLAKAAIPNIDEQIVNIGKKEDYFQCKLDSELGNAMKFHAAGKKREALQCLKRKRR